MIALLVAASLAFVVAIAVTPVAIRYFRRRKIGQFIQEEIEGHAHKQGTPTMGGLVMVVGVLVAYVLAHVTVYVPGVGVRIEVAEFGLPGALAVLALVGMATIGFFDDYIKFTRKRSLGLSKSGKFGGQLVVAAAFAWGAHAAGVSTRLSFVRPLDIDLGVFFPVLVLLMLTGAANGANLADGMDGLAAGSAALMFGAFTMIAFWQWRNPSVYATPDARELAIVSAAMLGAILGFLWWNAHPAQIFMGDVGSNAIGGLLAALAILTSTELLLVVLAGFYVAETLSVIIQVASFRIFGRRVFRMTPFHFHFDLMGWPETTIVVRLWIISGILVGMAIGFFYADYVAVRGLLR